jgi:hypothetical protein
MIDQRTTDESDFLNWTPAASRILEYLKENSEINNVSWGFDSANIKKCKSLVYASFSFGL